MEARGSVYPRIAGVVILLAIVVRLSLLLPAAASDPNRLRINDSAAYESIATNLASNGVYSSSKAAPFDHEIDRPPVYPLFLAFFRVIGFSGILAPLFVQVLLYGLLLYVVYRWCSSRFDPAAACAAVVFCGFELSGISASVMVMTESVFALLFFGSVVTGDPGDDRDKMRRVLSGVLLGVAVLCRPVAKYWVLPAAVMMGVTGRGARSRALPGLALFVAIPLLVMTGWSYVNYVRGGRFTLSIVEARNLVDYRAAEVLAEAEHLSREEAVARLHGEKGDATVGDSESPRSTAIRVFLDHPGTAARITVKGAAQALFAPGAGLFLSVLGRPSERVGYQESEMQMGLARKVLLMFSTWDFATLSVIGSLAFLAVLYSMGAIGVAQLARRGRWRTLALLVVPIAYLLVASAGPEAGSRFRVPMLPFLSVLGGVGLVECIGYVRRALGRAKSPVVTGGGGE